MLQSIRCVGIIGQVEQCLLTTHHTNLQAYEGDHSVLVQLILQGMEETIISVQSFCGIFTTSLA